MPRPVEALPCGSRSMISVRWPSSARQAPTLMVVVVLPTPPFWLATAMTRGSGRPAGRSSSGSAVGSRRPQERLIAAALGRAQAAPGRAAPHSLTRSRTVTGQASLDPADVSRGTIGCRTTRQHRRCSTWNIASTPEHGAPGRSRARPRTASRLGGRAEQRSSDRPAVRRLADDDRPPATSTAAAAAQRSPRRAEARGRRRRRPGVEQRAGQSLGVGVTHLTRSPSRAGRRAGQVIGPRRPPVDEDDRRSGRARRSRGPGTPPPLPRSTTVPATSARATTNARRGR